MAYWDDPNFKYDERKNNGPLGPIFYRRGSGYQQYNPATGQWNVGGSQTGAAGWERYDPKTGTWVYDEGRTWGDLTQRRSAYQEYVNGGGQPGGPQSIDANDLASTSESWSGLPSWATEGIRKTTKKYAPEAFAGISKSVRDLNNAPETIEQQRKNLNLQYQRDINTPTRDVVNSAMAGALGRGTAGSSMMGNFMGRIGSQLAAGAGRQQTESNTWAANSLLQNLKDRVSANQGFGALMGDLWGQTRSSRSSSYNPNFAGMDFSTQ
jgi:hypothetical protein